jgi:Winged helix DNA-binding domain
MVGETGVTAPGRSSVDMPGWYEAGRPPPSAAPRASPAWAGQNEAMTERTLSIRELNRALLARQLLLERSPATIEAAIEQVGGLQTQYAPSGYVGLWTRLTGFRREALTAALADRTVIQATLLRTTIHMVSRREFWRYALGVRNARRVWSLRIPGRGDEAALVQAAERTRAALADGPKTVKELDGVISGFLGSAGLWVDLVRVPPSGTWERRRADRLALADSWVGPEDATEDEGLAHLVRTYLRAFGPAALKDIASWAGISATAARRASASLELVRYRDEAGRELLDLPGAPLPDEDTPAPVRFLPHWEAVLLVHARRTGILPEEHRPTVFTSKNPFSVGTVLVDGRVAAAWSLRDGRIVVEPFEAIGARDRDAIEDERAALEAFHA